MAGRVADAGDGRGDNGDFRGEAKAAAEAEELLLDGDGLDVSPEYAGLAEAEEAALFQADRPAGDFAGPAGEEPQGESGEGGAFGEGRRGVWGIEPDGKEDGEEEDEERRADQDASEP